ncbi:MAG: peptidase [Chitinophagaceae bacterium]|nr:peptidase [Chitinophagaceae bacterium]
MKNVNKYLFVIPGILYFSLAFAQKQTAPEGSTPKDFAIPGKKTNTLSNGLKSTIVQYGDIPKVNISLVIKTGNIHEGPNEIWLADLTGEMVKQGTKKDNFKILAEKVAAMGGDININVGPDQFAISGSVLSEFAPAFINVIADLIINPALPASELPRLKDDLKRQLTYQKSVPQTQAQEKFAQAIYKDHPYGTLFPTEKMIDSYTLSMVKGFYDKNFGAKRSVIYVVGKYDEAAVNTAINKAFRGWRGGPDVYYPPVNPVTKQDTIIVDRKNAPQTTIILGLPSVVPQSNDYVPYLITNSVLGGSFGSRITSNIREDKGYTYSPRSVIQNRHNTSVWYEQADVTSENTVAALREIEKEINRLQHEIPTKEELQGFQNYEAGIFVLRNSSPAGIIGQLNFLDQNNLPDSYLADLVKNMHKVTPEQVSEIARKYLKYENMTVVLVGDKESINKQVTTKKGF